MAKPSRTPRSTDWTRDQLLKALSLYWQIPFGQYDKRNRKVIALATEIGRTPSAVSRKLGNLASLDPFHRARGVKGLSNASHADRSIWEEFYGRWEALAEASPEFLREKPSSVATETTDYVVTEAIRLVTSRIGQAFFRNAVLASWGGRCALTDISEPSLLRASHIQPWSSHVEFRLDPSNGLCLNALHDAAFDRGLITFSDRFELKLSRRLRETVPESVFLEMFARREGTSLRPADRFSPSCEAMAWHREQVFMT